MASFSSDHQPRFEVVSRAEALAMTGFRHACHAMLYAPSQEQLFNKYDIRAAVMMQMRFDGKIGFPGGLVDPGETLEQAVNRELSEEIAYRSSDMSLTEESHRLVHLYHEEKLLLHFYIRELSFEEFVQLERDAVHAQHYGTEVLGLIRCPVYTLTSRPRAPARGLPAFLRNNFCGNAREQLLFGLKHCSILSEADLKSVMEQAGLPSDG